MAWCSSLCRVRAFGLFLVMVILLVPASAVSAQESLPVAFRTWPNQTVSVETYWGFTIAVGPGAADVPGIDQPDQTLGGANLVFSFSSNEETTQKWDEQSSVGRVAIGSAQVDPLQVALDRKPNELKAGVLEDDAQPTSRAATIWAWQPDIDEPSLLLPIAVVRVDGIDMVYGSAYSLNAAAPDILKLPGIDDTVDLVVLVVGEHEQADTEPVKAIANRLNANAVCVIGKTDEVLAMSTRSSVGNTTALIAGEEPAADGPELIMHAEGPWKAPEEMAGLYDNLDAEGRKWSKVFEPLSVNQMNHRPSNGTHTPRWNIEHMASRQMFFITAAYHAADSRFPHIKLDPKQMPPDYVARHPDWNGAEEARRVYRTSAFVRRFAYLYHGRALNEPIAPRSRIRFAPIVRQVTRHYAMHTPNVQDKMKLDDWPPE